MKNVLIVLTDKYPYGDRETFVETERPSWSKFDRVFICPVLVRKEDKIRESFHPMSYETVIRTYDNKPRFFSTFKNILGSFSLSDYGHELSLLRKSKRLSFSNIKRLFYMGVLSNLRIKRIEKAILPLLDKTGNEKRLLYSFWMFEPVIVGTALKNKFKCMRLISRTHRYDLYEEFHPTGYLPFREYVLNRLDHVYSVSTDGVKYLSKRFNGQYDNKISVSRLGTLRHFEDFNGTQGQEPVIVSCSYLVPVKRVGRILDALKEYNRPISWYHFGDGTLRQELENRIKDLPDCVHAYLMGSTENDAIQRFYSEHYIDAFVNVSESEGIPVSIMEAQSYGLPVIATDVGGSSELVHDGENGVLLHTDFSDQDLLNALEETIKKSSFFREKAKQTWLEMSDAKRIYDEFFQHELEIIENNYTKGNHQR